MPAAGSADVAKARALFLDYQAWLDVDLCFQGFAEELASLPGSYVPLKGGLWLARVGSGSHRALEGEVAGVVALRPLAQDGVCELKRLWVRPGFRGLGLGRRLVETALAAARAAGHRTMLLDTLPQMADARRLYDLLGFRETTPYYHNPVAGVVYMALALHESDARSG
jgi:ribosomal protein S18 acetylase RimI-like enzyme